MVGRALVVFLFSWVWVVGAYRRVGEGEPPHATLESVGWNAVRLYNARREHKGYNGEGDAAHIHHKPVHPLVFIETLSGEGKIVSNYMNITEWDVVIAAGLTR